MEHFIIGTIGDQGSGKTSVTENILAALGNQNQKEVDLRSHYRSIYLPSGILCQIGDIPSTPRYFKDIITAASTFDMAIVTVRADAGLTPQVSQYLEMIRLLNITSGIILISKSDLISKEAFEDLERELKKAAKNSFLIQPEFMKFSRHNPEDTNTLIRRIDRILWGQNPKDAQNYFSMTIDDITINSEDHTIIWGNIKQGDVYQYRSVKIFPINLKYRIREIISGGVPVEYAVAGQRVGLNIGKSGDKIRIGDLVAKPGSVELNNQMDASIEISPLARNPFTNQTQIRFYVDGTQTNAKIILLDSDTLEPGQSGYCRISLENMIATDIGCRFILRSIDSPEIIGGGKILDTKPGYHRRFDKTVIEILQQKDRGTPEDMLQLMMDREPYMIFSLDSVSTVLNLPLPQASEIIISLEKQKKMYLFGNSQLLLVKTLNHLSARFMEILRILQAKDPSRLGRLAEEIRQNLPKMEDRLFREIIIYLKTQNEIRENEGMICSTDFVPQLTKEQTMCHEWLQKVMVESEFMPPTRREIFKNVRFKKQTINDALQYMIFTGDLIEIDERIIVARETITKAKKIIGNLILKEGPIAATQAREALGTTRKYIIPLLEYFDRIYFTKRKGENGSKRILVRENIVTGI